MARPDKFENLMLPNFEQWPADQQISSAHNDVRFYFNGSVIERSSSTEQIEQESLYLVISMVCEKERRSRVLIRSSGKELESRLASSFFEGTSARQSGQIFSVKWQPETASEPVNKSGVFQALDST
jgi:hypothetical protein